MIDRLDVEFQGKKIGSLVSSKKGNGQQICFYFDNDYPRANLDLFPLRAPLLGAAAQRGMPVYPEDDKLFGGLPSFIADSMPDHWGNVLFSEWARANHIRTKDLTPLDRLAYIGRRGMGALEFVPPTSLEMENPFRVEISELSKLAKEAIIEARNFHAVIKDDFAIESLFKVGTSAGGRRPKAVINVNPITGECYSGQVPTPIAGFVPMIIKFDEHSDVPSTRIEYSYYLMALQAGMQMMPSRLVEGEGEAHFLTERFDRIGNEKVHVQTLAAMSPRSDSYEDLFDACIKIGICPDELKRVFLQMVMNVIAGNVDDHNKNFSFIMDSYGAWHIAPVYDFTFTVDTSAPFYVNRHSMTINGKNQDITNKDFLDMASRYNIKGAPEIIHRAIASVKNYRRHAQQAGVPDEWTKRIESEIESRLSSL